MFSPEEHLFPYAAVRHRVTNDGYVVWRPGVHGSVEILHLVTADGGRGYGVRLLKEVLYLLLEAPPLDVFAIVPPDDWPMQGFYQATGFLSTTIRGIHPEGRALFFSQRFEQLCSIHGVRS